MSTKSDKHTSRQVDEYLQPSNKKRLPKSFDNVIRSFISQFIINEPDKANIFLSSNTVRSSYALLIRAAILFEAYFPNLEFEQYLQLCISNNCQPKRICELSKWYEPVLIGSDNKQNKSNIYYSNHINKRGAQSVQFNLWHPGYKKWRKKSIALSKFTNHEQKKILRLQSISHKVLVEKITVESKSFLFYVGHHSKQATFELITHVLCCALLIFDIDITAETRLEYLVTAHNYLSELILVNIPQSNRGKKSKADPLQQIISEVVTRYPVITTDDLKNKIEDRQHGGVIEDIDADDVRFLNKGKSDFAPISGLKDRLHRAKKKLFNTNLLINSPKVI